MWAPSDTPLYVKFRILNTSFTNGSVDVVRIQSAHRTMGIIVNVSGLAPMLHIQNVETMVLMVTVELAFLLVLFLTFSQNISVITFINQIEHINHACLWEVHQPS